MEEKIEDLNEQIAQLKDQVIDLKKKLLSQRIELNNEKLDAMIELQAYYQGIIDAKEKEDKSADFKTGTKKKAARKKKNDII